MGHVCALRVRFTHFWRDVLLLSPPPPRQWLSIGDQARHCISVLRRMRWRARVPLLVHGVLCQQCTSFVAGTLSRVVHIFAHLYIVFTSSLHRCRFFLRTFYWVARTNRIRRSLIKIKFLESMGFMLSFLLYTGAFCIVYGHKVYFRMYYLKLP